MPRIAVDLRKITEPWIVRTFFLKPGQVLPSGWQLVKEDYAIKEDMYSTGTVRHQPIVARRPA